MIRSGQTTTYYEIYAVVTQLTAVNLLKLRVLIYKESFYHIWSLPKIIRQLFGLRISLATNCVTVGIKVLKLCFTSEFEISRGADLEHFRKVSHFVTYHVYHLVTLHCVVANHVWHFGMLYDVLYITQIYDYKSLSMRNSFCRIWSLQKISLLSFWIEDKPCYQFVIEGILS